MAKTPSAIGKRRSYKNNFSVIKTAYFCTKEKKMTPLQSIISEIQPILKKYPITRAGIFGSFVRNEQTETSDVDILIELSYAISLLDYVAIKLELEDKIGRKVDLVEYKTLKPRLKDYILNEAMTIL